MRYSRLKYVLKTRTAKYFLGLYKQSTIFNAVEVAAEKERGSNLPGLQNFSKIPVDLNRIAASRDIRFGPKLPENSNKDAFLIPQKDGFLLRLNPKQTRGRTRFTIAHEIGHTLFYRNMRHQIGISDKMEIGAEEFICEGFAGALLMPTSNLLNLIPQKTYENPLGLFTNLEFVSKKFDVSLPALISRIGTIGSLLSLPYILLVLRYGDNYFKGIDKQLRIRVPASMGELRNIITWFNRSAKNINLRSPEKLYIKWKDHLALGKEAICGRYALDSDSQIVRPTKDNMHWVPEEVIFSILKDGKWFEKKLPVLCSSCLYAARGWDEKQAYIITIIKTRDQDDIAPESFRHQSSNIAGNEPAAIFGGTAVF